MSEGELGTPLLGASPELEDGTFGTDDGEQSTTWTPQDSPRHMRVVSAGQVLSFIILLQYPAVLLPTRTYSGSLRRYGTQR